jgi:hypothetical protein
MALTRMQVAPKYSAEKIFLIFLQEPTLYRI